MSHSLSFNGPPFVEDSPAPQNAINFFDTWVSKFPEGCGVTSQGQSALFEDPRILWLDEKLKSVNGKGINGLRVLEMGPLEAGHTYMLDRLGAARVDAIESNGISYLKCLVVKETMGLPSAKFELGDAVKYLEQIEEPYDLCVCSGFLYHQVDPESLIRLLGKSARYVYLWSITFHPSLYEKLPEIKQRFGDPKCVKNDDGFEYTLYPQYYGELQDYSSFWGGTQPSSCWMSSEDIQRCFRHYGFKLEAVQEEPNPFGVAISLLASVQDR